MARSPRQLSPAARRAVRSASGALVLAFGVYGLAQSTSLVRVLCL